MHVKGNDSLNLSQFPDISITPQKVYSDFGENICRFCGGAKDHCTNIFGIGGKRKKISDKAPEVLNISIREKDVLPYKICRLCEGDTESVLQVQENGYRHTKPAEIKSNNKDV